MQLHFHNYRFADEILSSENFQKAKTEVLDILSSLPAIKVGEAPWSIPSKKPKKTKFPVDQNAMNRWLDDQFQPLGWEWHPKIVPGTNLAGDYRKDRVQIEVQFGNMARWTYDILKFQICYSQGIIDVGILALPMQSLAKEIGENIAHFERVSRELPHAKLSITLPILVIGLESD